MRLQKVDLNLFVVLEVIYAERNLTRAADILCLTQPTVSNALSRLRKSFNDELFVRTPQGMVPTPVTENIIGRVRDALQLLDASVLDGSQFEAAHSDRVFRLSMNDVAETLLLPELMDDVSRLAPGISVESYYTLRRDLPAALSSGELEMAIEIEAPADANICHHPLFTERYVCAVRKDHPSVGSKLTLDQYLALGHIHVSSRRRGLGLVDTYLSRKGYHRQIHLRLQHYLVVPEIVHRSNLALTVPDHWAKRAGLKVVELPFELSQLQSHLLWHKSADGDQANLWLREKIIEICNCLEMTQ